MNRFFQPGQLSKYRILHFNADEVDVIQSKFGELITLCRQMGMTVPTGMDWATNLVQVPSDGPSIFADLANKAKNEGVYLLFIVLPDAAARRYEGLKFILDCKVGIQSICLLYSKLIKNNMTSYLPNIALKVNMKVGGVNHSTQNDNVLKGIMEKHSSLLRATMLLGADVTHSGSRLLPSICAVVGSYQPDFTRLPASLSIQPNGEMIKDMERMFEERLDYFISKNTQRRPDSIIMFRDGVSESQYRHVLDQEVSLIDKVLNRKGGKTVTGKGDKTKLTVVVVGKRHNTRFFPSNPDPDFTHKDNTPPGLVVDRFVTAVGIQILSIEIKHEAG